MSSSSSSSSASIPAPAGSNNSGANNDPYDNDSSPMYFPLTTILLLLIFVIFKADLATETLGTLAYYCNMTERNVLFLAVFTLIALVVVSNGVMYFLREKKKNSEEKKINDEWLTIERAALIDIFNASNGMKWKDKTRWCTDEPIERWHGVKVDNLGKTKRVNKLILAENNLTGTLSPSIGKLQYLNEVDFRQNSLEGPIPEELGDCEVLEGIYINDNKFTGKIPRNIFKLPYIKGFYCYNNFFEENEKKAARIDLEKSMENNPSFILHAANI